MLVNFLLMSLSVLTLPRRNPSLAAQVAVIPDRRVQFPLAVLGVVVLAGFLAVHTWKDLSAPAAGWYFRSTPVWAIVMALASVIYIREIRSLRRRGVDVDSRFHALPPE
jgi:uncharacterized membrane protein